MNLQFDIPKTQASIIKVFGVGGGGGNAVNHMYHQGIKGVDFMICNTDSQALDLSPIPHRIHIGNNLTDGRGAGSDPEVGRKAAQESAEEIKTALSTNTKMVFITAGMGGGTGTGAAPVIAKVAKDLGILTVGIVTMPFKFEGPRRKQRALEGVENLKKHVDTLLVIDNEKLREMYGNVALGAAFGNADDILTTAAKGIAEIITVAGYVNVDFEDVKTVMSNSGVAIMGSAAADGEDRALRAVEGALHSPLLSENDIQGANHILLNITSGTKEILMDEITIITSYIQEEAGHGADLIWGHCYDETLGDKIMVTLIATAFEGHRDDRKKDKTVVTLEEKAPEPRPFSYEPAPAVTNTFVPTPPPIEAWEPVRKEEPAPVQVQQPVTPVVAPTQVMPQPAPMPAPAPQVQPTPPPMSYPSPAVTQLDLPMGSARHEEEEVYYDIEEQEAAESTLARYGRIRQSAESLRTTAGLDSVEKTPAYMRRKFRLQNIPHSSDSNISRYTLSDEGEEQVSIKPKNPFLHDNVD